MTYVNNRRTIILFDPFRYKEIDLQSISGEKLPLATIEDQDVVQLRPIQGRHLRDNKTTFQAESLWLGRTQVVAEAVS